MSFQSLAQNAYQFLSAYYFLMHKKVLLKISIFLPSCFFNVFFIFSKNFLFLYTILRSFYDNHNMGRSLWTVFLSDFDDFSKK